MLGTPAPNGRLPRRVLPQAGLQHVAHDDLVDLQSGVDSSPLHSASRIDQGAQLGRAETC